MNAANVATTSIDFRGIAEALAPGRFRFDPLGIVSGYKAYLVFSGLSAKSDAELAELGLSRKDVPGAAMAAVKVLRNG